MVLEVLNVCTEVTDVYRCKIEFGARVLESWLKENVCLVVSWRDSVCLVASRRSGKAWLAAVFQRLLLHVIGHSPAVLCGAYWRGGEENRLAPRDGFRRVLGRCRFRPKSMSDRDVGLTRTPIYTVNPKKKINVW